MAVVSAGTLLFLKTLANQLSKSTNFELFK